MSESPSGIVRHWRVAVAALLCAAGGVGLRMTLRESGTQAAAQKSGRAEAENAAGVLKKGKLSGKARAAARLTVEQLLALPSGDRLLAVLEMLPSLSADECSLLVHAQLGKAGNRGARITDPDVAPGYLTVLFTRWAEADPDGMVLALEAPALMYELDARRLAVQAWAGARGAAAVEAIGNKWPRLAQEAAWQVFWRDPGSTERLLPWLKDSLGEGGVEYTSSAEKMVKLLGPEQAIALLAASGGTQAFDYVVGAVAEADFPRALAAVKALPAGAVREEAMQDLLEDLNGRAGHEDSDALRREFMTEYEKLPPGRTRDALTDEYAAVLARESPDKALEWARALPPGEARGEAISAAGYALEAAGQWAEATKVFAEAWSDLPSEMSWANWNYYTSSYSGSSFPTGGPANRAFTEWYKSDASAALAWLESVASPGQRAMMLRPLARDGLVPFSLLPDSEMQLSLATEYLRALSEPRKKDYAPLPQIQLPPDLERLARLSLTNGDDQTWASLSSEDRRLVSSDAWAWSLFPDSRIEFFNKLSPEERSLSAWYYMGHAQAGMDLGAASEWLDTLPPGPERDAAATALVERLSAEGDDRDGEAAFAWAVSMSGAEERRRYIEQAAKVWAEQDAEAATKAVLGSDLPPEEAVHLAEELQKGGPR
jgi:hypothetical protein